MQNDTYKKYTDWKILNEYYLYGYLRDVDDEYAEAGTLYYIGLGQAKRILSKHLIPVPKNKSNMVIFAEELTKNEAELGEINLINYYGRINDKTGILVNISKGGSSGLSGTVLVRDELGTIIRVDVDDSRYISGKLPHVCKDLITVKDDNGNTMSVSKYDERYLSGELVYIHTDTVVVKDMNGDITRVSKNDSRYLSGELVYFHNGTIVVKDINGDITRVSKNDSRYLSGELTGIAKNNVNVKDKNGNMFSVSKNDERYLSGELVGVNKGKSWSLSKQRKKATCPNCNKVGDSTNMKRWHLPKCQVPAT
jgi:uncharacterized cupin superfamily protein